MIYAYAYCVNMRLGVYSFPMLATLSPVTFQLKRLREEAGLTQSELAEAIGIRQATISDLERGTSQRIEFKVLDALCTVLSKALARDVQPGELLERESKPRCGERSRRAPT